MKIFVMILSFELQTGRKQKIKRPHGQEVTRGANVSEANKRYHDQGFINLSRVVVELWKESNNNIEIKRPHGQEVTRG
ncbi:MAG: hypothetical protein LLG37_09605, partial [Spirochaetia bacterium]|nr:hypothetical protein [Spirochaetia bacterium]